MERNLGSLIIQKQLFDLAKHWASANALLLFYQSKILEFAAISESYHWAFATDLQRPRFGGPYAVAKMSPTMTTWELIDIVLRLSWPECSTGGGLL
jgi:hypothetical protein